jgi:hypothetical protein
VTAPSRRGSNAGRRRVGSVVDLPDRRDVVAGDDLDVGRWLDVRVSKRGEWRWLARLSCWASARILRAVAHVVSALLLTLSKTKACFRPLAGPLELAQTVRAGGPLSVGLRFVELVALAGVLSLRSQIVKVIGGHALAELTSRAQSGVAVAHVNGGRVYARSRCSAACSSTRSGDRAPTHLPGRAPRHAARC